MKGWFPKLTTQIGSTVNNVTGATSQNQFAAAEAQKQRDYQTEMWNLTNQYNSPLAQMERFKEAGLNPHLIYGKGTHGNATAMSGAKASPSGGTGNPFQMMQGIISNAMNAFRDREVIQNLKVDRELKGLDVIRQAIENKRAMNDLDFEKKKNPLGIKQMEIANDRAIQQLQHEGVKYDIDRLSKDEQILAKKYGVRLQRAQVKNLNTQSELRIVEKELKKLHVEMRKDGIEPTDEKYWRIAGSILREKGYSNKAVGSGIFKSIKERGEKSVVPMDPFNLAPFIIELFK